MNIKVIDPKTGKPQWFWASLDSLSLQHTSHLIEHYGENAKLRCLAQACEEVRNSGLGDVALIPLIGDLSGDILWHWRGHGEDVPNRCIPDPEPFVVRGRRLPTVEAKPSQGATFWWKSKEYGVELTPGQKAALQERFDAALHAALTQSVLVALKREAIERTVAYAKNEVANYKRQLDQIAAYQWPDLGRL